MIAEKRALIVDDNDLNRRLLARFLARMGWQSEVASSGEAAIAALAEQSFNMVLLDLRMPGLSGEQACIEIRRTHAFPFPIIAYTGHSIPEEHERILAVGFSDLLVKPISFNDVERMCEGLSAAALRQGDRA